MNTYAKLNTGAWGIRATTKVAEGDRVTVTKKDGSTKSETIDRVLWTDGSSVWLCAISAAKSSPARKCVPCGYPGCNPPAYCDECDGEGRYASW